MAGRKHVWEVDENEKILDLTILDKVERLSAQGLTMDQIGRTFGMHPDTYRKYQKRDQRIRDAYDNGKARGIGVITNALFEKARNGDTTAMIFYLKNRDPANWSDVQHDQRILGTLNVTEIKRTFVDAAKLTDGKDDITIQ